MVNYFSGKPGDACWTCFNSVNEAFMDNQNQKEDILKFLKKKELPEDAVLSLKDLSEFHHENLSMSGADHLIKAALEHTGTSSPSPPVVPPADKSSQQHEGKAEGIKKEDYTVFVKQLQKEVLAELVPAKIRNFTDIGFIPKYPNPPPQQPPIQWFVTNLISSGICIIPLDLWVPGFAYVPGQPYWWSTLGFR